MQLSQQFVLLRMTFLRGVNINRFVYDYDQTWMAFFLDADGRIYCRYGSRDSTSADSHNSPEGLLHTMQEVLRLHKEEMDHPKPGPSWPPAVIPADLPEMQELRYSGSCVRCHMMNEAIIHKKRKDKKFEPGALWVYPLPDNVGLKIDPKLGNVVREVLPDSFAAKAGVKPGDVLRWANRHRVLTIADLQHVLNELDAKSTLSLDVERAGKEVTAVLNLEGAWRRTDLSWRKSIRQLTYRSSGLVRMLLPLQPDERTKLGIGAGELGFRMAGIQGDAQQAGLKMGDVIVAFDGKRKVPYRTPQMYMYLEHKSGDKMEVTFLRDGKEQTVTLVVP